MNASSLYNIGGEVLMGTIPSSLLSGLTWATLLNYIDVKQVDLPMAQDICFPWMKSCISDTTQTSPASTPGMATSTSVCFVAVRVPYSSTFTPALDYENYNNYSVTPLPNYEKVINAKVQPIDDQAYIAAKRIIGLTGKSAMCIEPTSAVGSAFSAAAQLLGKHVAAYVGKKMPSWINSASSFLDGLFSTQRVRTLALMSDCSDKTRDLDSIQKLIDTHILPEHYGRLLIELLQYQIRFTDSAIEVVHLKFPNHLAVVEDEKIPFGSRRVVKLVENLEEDEKEYDKFSVSRRSVVPETSSVRSSSLTKK